MRLSIATAVCLSIIGVAAADHAKAAIDRKYTNIPAQELGSALQTLAQEHDIQVVYLSDSVDKLQTGGAVGDFSAEDALKKLLRGTGLSFRYLDEKTVTVMPISAAIPGNGQRQNQRATKDDVLADSASAQTQDTVDGQGSASVWERFRVAQLDQPASSGGGASSNSASSSGGLDSLQEVVVTAERREEGVQKVPASVVALSQKSLDDLHIQNFSDLASLVPGLDLTATSPGAQGGINIIIRGVASTDNSPTSQLYIDETPVAIRVFGNAAPSGTFLPDIFDLDRVEVLRGPQGTLFGASAMGGAVRFITPQPSLDESSGYAKSEISDTEHGAPSYAVGLAYGAPIVPGVAGFRLSGWFHYDGGFIDVANPFTGQVSDSNANARNSYTFRPAVTVAPIENLTITAAVFIQHHHSDYPDEYWASDIPSQEYNKHESGAVASQYALDDIKLPSLAIKYELPGGLSLQSNTSFLDRWYDNVDEDTEILEAAFTHKVLNPNVPPSFAILSQQVGGTVAWQEEIRLTSPNDDSRWHWVAGAYFRRATESVSQLISPDLTPFTEGLFGAASEDVFGLGDYVYKGQQLAGYDRFSAVDEERSLFGNVDFNLTTKLRLSAGVRIEHSVVEQQQQLLAGPLDGNSYVTPPDEVQTPVTPKFSATYQYTQSDMVYASAAKGYRPGGGNSVYANMGACTESLNALGLTSVPETFQSDSLWSYEIGAKDSAFDGRLTSAASIYYIDWKNIQTDLNLANCAAEFTANVGKAIIQGFDYQISVIPFEGFKVGASVAYTDAYFPDGTYGPPNSAGVRPVYEGAGDKLLNVTPWSAAVNTEYSWSMSALGGVIKPYFRVDYRWRDAMSRQDPNTPGYEPTAPRPGDPTYSTLNLRLGAERGGLDVSAFVNNVTNADPALNYDQRSRSTLYYAVAIRPLTAGVTVLFHF